MVELARYRREKGLTPYPATDETTPLLLPIGRQTRALKHAPVHSIVKQVLRARLTESVRAAMTWN